jgi:hypothetical protein
MTVTVHSALTAVQASVGQLRKAAGELVLVADEDAPRGGRHHLVDVVRDAAVELAGEAAHVSAALEGPGTSGGVGRPGPSAVARCQAHVNTLGTILVQQLAAPELLVGLAGMKRGQGHEVGAWAAGAVRCVKACQRAIWADLQPALLGYWIELIEAKNLDPAAGDRP